jgi:hypothetical protein
MSEINFDDFFEAEEGECWSRNEIAAHTENETFHSTENEEDFDFDPTILQQFERATISIEKIQKELFNFDEKGERGIRGNCSGR